MYYTTCIIRRYVHSSHIHWAVDIGWFVAVGHPIFHAHSFLWVFDLLFEGRPYCMWFPILDNMHNVSLLCFMRFSTIRFPSVSLHFHLGIDIKCVFSLKLSKIQMPLNWVKLPSLTGSYHMWQWNLSEISDSITRLGTMWGSASALWRMKAEELYLSSMCCCISTGPSVPEQRCIHRWTHEEWWALL